MINMSDCTDDSKCPTQSVLDFFDSIDKEELLNEISRDEDENIG